MAVAVASEELRNNTAEVLRRVEAGEHLIITSRGKPVAELVPVRRPQRRWMPYEELIELLATAQADPGLREDLARYAGDTTDDLGPIE